VTTEIEQLVKREPAYKLTLLLGSVEPKTVYREEGGRVACYSYAIHRDQYGRETHRTEPEPLSSIGYDDGTTLTMEEFNRIKDEKPKKKRGLLARLFGV